MHLGLLSPRRFFDAFVVGRLDKATAVEVGTVGADAGAGDGALSALWLLRAGDDAAIDEQLTHSRALLYNFIHRAGDATEIEFS